MTPKVVVWAGIMPVKDAGQQIFAAVTRWDEIEHARIASAARNSDLAAAKWATCMVTTL